jgi:type I restriction enzyme S subunit
MELSSDALASLSIMQPPLDEQRRIADFLDAETARVAQLELGRRQQLALIETRYRTAISEFVTPGIATDIERSEM